MITSPYEMFYFPMDHLTIYSQSHHNLIYSQSYHNLPHIFSEGVVLVGPRSCSVYSISVHSKPLPHLFQPLFHDWHNSAITGGTNIHQHIAPTADRGDESLQEILNGEVITQRGVPTVAPRVTVNSHGIFPLMSLQFT